ncbi:hypothetical protein [Cyanobium sp. Cruz CV11-17]|uniref:hypothetical protein n=1 Tax=Cyanobium sp. Cruz CV11-17 TaxID=2823709 RepID=UPI003965877B
MPASVLLASSGSAWRTSSSRRARQAMPRRSAVRMISWRACRNNSRRRGSTASSRSINQPKGWREATQLGGGAGATGWAWAMGAEQRRR